MNCKDCYWCALECAIRSDRVCCNQESENYNKVFSEEEARQMGCEYAETEQAVDYRTLTPWQFASKYYM